MEFLHSASRWAAKDSFAPASNTFNVDVTTTTGQQYIQGVLLFGAIYIAVGLIVWCIVTALDCCLCCRSRKRMALARCVCVCDGAGSARGTAAATATTP